MFTYILWAISLAFLSSSDCQSSINSGLTRLDSRNISKINFVEIINKSSQFKQQQRRSLDNSHDSVNITADSINTTPASNLFDSLSTTLKSVDIISNGSSNQEDKILQDSAEFNQTLTVTPASESNQEINKIYKQRPSITEIFTTVATSKITPTANSDGMLLSTSDDIPTVGYTQRTTDNAVELMTDQVKNVSSGRDGIKAMETTSPSPSTLTSTEFPSTSLRSIIINPPNETLNVKATITTKSPSVGLTKNNIQVITSTSSYLSLPDNSSLIDNRKEIKFTNQVDRIILTDNKIDVSSLPHKFLAKSVGDNNNDSAYDNGYSHEKSKANSVEEQKQQQQSGVDDEEESDAGSDVYLLSSHRKCQPDRCDSVDWDSTDASILASKPCPIPYIGKAYRACYSMGHWDEPDLTECRLPHLREIQNLIFYHVHKHLVDGLYPLAEELNRLLQSSSFPIRSPMDKLDALDSLNSILKAKVRIKLDDEDRDIPFIKSLISSSEQLLTRIPLTFSSEIEKNALITMKSVETIFGLKSLSESLLRALIVFCNDGTIRKIKSFNSVAKNIVMSLTHITPFGDRISLLETENNVTFHLNNNLPKADLFLDDLRKYGIGLSEIWIQNMATDLDTDNIILVSDMIVISAVPPVSIEVNFEQSPKVEIHFNLHKSFSFSDNLKCGKLRIPRELWSHKECQVIFRNLTSIRCSCKDLGIFGVIHVKSSTSSRPSHHSPCHLNTLIIYISTGLSLALILATISGQIYLLATPETRRSAIFMLNLLTCLALIEIIFLTGKPFKSSRSSSLFPYVASPSSLPGIWSTCRYIAMGLHYLHLVAAFWMLSYSVYLHKKLWRHNDSSDLNSNETSYMETNGNVLPVASSTSQQSLVSPSSTDAIPSNLSSHHHSQQYYHHLHHQQQQQITQPLSSNFSSASSASSLAHQHMHHHHHHHHHHNHRSHHALEPWSQPNLHKEPGTWSFVNLIIFSWITPIICVLISNTINPQGYESKRYCWMSIEGGMMFSFIVPVSLLIMSNTVTMLLILKRFFAYKPVTHKIEIEKVEPSLRSGVSILPFFAVNWFLSVLALEDTATTIFQYLFAFCNLIQHLLIFLFHCYQKPEVHQMIRLYFCSHGKRVNKSTLKSKKSYWCSGNCANVPLLIYAEDGSVSRLPDNCMLLEGPSLEDLRLREQ